MTYDRTFPEYIRRMVKWLALLTVIVGGLLYPFLGWQGSLGFAVGTLFHIAFLLFLKAKFHQWDRAAREPLFIGQRLAMFTMARFVLEILLALAVVIATPLHVFAFLAGLLSLPISSFVVKTVNVIKE